MARKTASIPPERGVFCNRTLNLRSIKAVGYDMDYTLVHYRVERWEKRAYEYTKHRLIEDGWPLEQLQFRPNLMIRGLVLDIELGNVLKANRFGYVKRAFHGTRPMAFEKQREVYSRIVVDLGEPRFVFMNTFFSLSEACLYAQLVDRLDSKSLPGVLGYRDLYKRVKTALDESHTEGKLKEEIIADPTSFVELDEDTPLALLDQKMAGKKLVLITNSEWTFANAMMSYAFDRFLPSGSTWRDLFEFVIVESRKPGFFSSLSPMYKIVDDEGLLKPARRLESGAAYHGSNAQAVEDALALSGDEILYVGDHIWGDVRVSKAVLRWRTALVLRELEDDVRALAGFSSKQADLDRMMAQKDRLEAKMYRLRLDSLRRRKKYGPKSKVPTASFEKRITEIRSRLEELDEKLTPLAIDAGRLNNRHWGLLMRAGNDKSHLARQVERSADVYMSRVSNLQFATPFAYLRSKPGSLPHDSR